MERTKDVERSCNPFQNKDGLPVLPYAGTNARLVGSRSATPSAMSDKIKESCDREIGAQETGADNDLVRTLFHMRVLMADLCIAQIDWDGPEDPENPKHWSFMRKWIAVTLVSLISFTTTAASSSVAPALPQIASDLRITSTVNQAMVFAIYGLGFVVGALPYGPLSELYGRVPVMHASFAIFLAFNIASGFAQTYGQLLVFRLLSGIGGSAPNTIGGGLVSDCFNAEDIGRGSAFYGLAPRLGPAIGPLLGGFIVQNLDWRWSFYITSMFAGALFVSALFFLQETRPSIRLKRKAIKLRKKTGNENLHTQDWPRQESDWQHLAEGLKRPFVFLGTHYIVQYLALYQFFLAGTLYLILSTYHRLFTEDYHESVQISGLNYISIGLGLIVGNQLCSRVSDKVKHLPPLTHISLSSG